MAVRTITACDICGAEPAANTTFSVGSAGYELDLCETHVAELNSRFVTFTNAARVTSGRRAVAAKPKKAAGAAASASAKRSDLAAIRVWANANGFTVGAKGRVPAAVVEAFDDAAFTGAPLAETAPAAGEAPAETAPAKKSTSKKAVAPKKAATKKSGAAKKPAAKKTAAAKKVSA